MNTLHHPPTMDVQTGYQCPTGLTITGAYCRDFESILTPAALTFVAALHRSFNEKRKWLLKERLQVEQKLDRGWTPQFQLSTKAIRESAWTVSPLPPDLLDRRVEITGPVERKMMINALNSGARVFMADLEDSNTPSWENCMQGQINLYDAVRKTISYTAPDSQKEYQLNPQTATLMVRPRGWHMEESHLTVDGTPVSASLFDFGLYFYHNAKCLLEQGSGPYFYLPKLESYLEARLWDHVFVFAQNYCRIPYGSIKATVLIETILASFQLHEILWELRDHSAGFNCGRWDYIFSFIKKFRNRDGFVFPDRAQVTMNVPCMRAYAQLVIQTCHRRGVHAIGGMAAQIPIKQDPLAHAAAIAKVEADKLREVALGHDGTWVAHPGLVEVAMQVFNQHMPEANQIERKLEDVKIEEAQLLQVPAGTITEAGLRLNINVGICYIESWLRGNGAVAIHHLMEDAATAEISRTQIWQWIQRKARLQDGRTITPALYAELKSDEIEKIKDSIGLQAFQAGRFSEAIALFDTLVLNPDFESFLTLPASQLLQSSIHSSTKS